MIACLITGVVHRWSLTMESDTTVFGLFCTLIMGREHLIGTAMLTQTLLRRDGVDRVEAPLTINNRCLKVCTGQSYGTLGVLLPWFWNVDAGWSPNACMGSRKKGRKPREHRALSASGGGGGSNARAPLMGKRSALLTLSPPCQWGKAGPRDGFQVPELW